MQNGAHSSNNDSESAVVLLDALPYIDFQYSDPVIQVEVDRLINEEMKKFQPPDYLSKFPEPEIQFSTEFLRTEYQRVATNAPQISLSMDRYRVEPPPDHARDDVNAWKASIERAQIRLEFQNNSLENLELLNRFGANAWKSHADQLQQLQQSLSQSLDVSRREIDAINRKRKADQLAVGSVLLELENEFWSQLSKNREIEHACLQLRSEIKRLKTLAIAQGLWKPPEESSSVVVSDSQRFDSLSDINSSSHSTNNVDKMDSDQ